MNLEIAIVFVIILCAVVLFATEKFTVDLVALTVLSTLLILGIITPKEAIAGFSNQATVTIAAMFIISAALFKTGAVNLLGKIASDAFRKNFWLGLIAVMIAVGIFSAFINNTPVVAIFIPIMLGVSKDIKVSSSKLLMPLSFASMFGGVCTLLGSSTNILVNSIAVDMNQPAFTMFEFAPLGIIMFVIGTTYMLTIGIRLIPERRDKDALIETFRMDEYITEIVILENSVSVGKTIADAPLVNDIDLAIIEVGRDGEFTGIPPADFVLEAGDVLRVRCDLEKLSAIRQEEGVAFEPGNKWKDTDFETNEMKLVEVVLSPNSDLVGNTIQKVKFREKFGATVLALRHRGKLLREKISNTQLDAGDALLLEVKNSRYNQLKLNKAFVVTSEIEQPTFRKSKLIPVLLIVLGVIVSATFNLMPIVGSAVIGSVFLVLIGSITMEEAYRAIEWRIIFLLAGILTLGVALEKSGGAKFISNAVFSNVEVWFGLVALVSMFYLMTSILTEVMSNNATGALLAPIAIATANSLSVSPRPFLVAVMFAASASFMTPVGYQTNTLIYGPGQYRFADFLKVGTPLNIIFWITATLLIPYFWEF